MVFGLSVFVGEFVVLFVWFSECGLLSSRLLCLILFDILVFGVWCLLCLRLWVLFSYICLDGL